MSTATVVTVPIPQATYDRLSRRASEENRSVPEVLVETINEAEDRREAFRRMGAAIAYLQEQSIVNGTSEMTMDEINEEIALYHREKAEAEALRKTA
jgi:hypothetical protein